MDYRKQINNKKTLNSLFNKVSTLVKTADDKIREIANETEEKLRETTTSFKETIQTNINDNFKKNLSVLAIETVEKTLIENGTNDIKTLTITLNETVECLSIERIITDLCGEYNQPLETYLTDVYKYNVLANLELFFGTNEQLEFIKTQPDKFTLTLKFVDEPICECNCDGDCNCDGNCGCGDDCKCHKDDLGEIVEELVGEIVEEISNSNIFVNLDKE